jgi:glycogen synthase
MRCELLAGAVALVNPVRQVEPFGMVNIESLAMGCPVIGPTFGSFPEILEPGVTGMLCRDLEEYVAAVDWAKRADRSACRAAAERRFSLDAVWPQYERHFRRVAQVGTKAGWSSQGQWPRGGRTATRSRQRQGDRLNGQATPVKRFGGRTRGR